MIPEQAEFPSLEAFEDVIAERVDLLRSSCGKELSLETLEATRRRFEKCLRFCSRLEIFKRTRLKFISKISENNLHIYGTEERGGLAKVLPIAIHGLCHNNFCFKSLILGLDDFGIPLQAVSWPGAGLSKGVPGRPMREMGVDDYVGELEKCIRGFNRDILLIGHSVGGLLAQKLAARMPEMTKGLVLLASNPPTNLRRRIKTLPETSLSKSIRGGLFFPRLLPEWRKNELFRLDTGKTEGEDSEEEVQEFIASSESDILDFEHAGSKFIADYAREGGHVDRNSVKCPILEIEGGNDVNETALSQPLSDQIIEYEFDNAKRMSLVKFYRKIESEGKTVIMPGAPHNMMMGVDSRKTASHIAEAIRLGLFPGF